MKLLLVDLDDTLINVKEFKRTLLSNLSSISGLSELAIESIYKGLKNLPVEADWQQEFIDRIKLKSPVTTNQLEAVFSNSLEMININASVFLYVQTFIGYKVLFSYGRNKFQISKLNKLNLKGEFNEIIIMAESKIDYLSKLIKEHTVLISDKEFQEVIIVDDDELFLKSVQENFSWITTLHPKELA